MFTRNRFLSHVLLLLALVSGSVAAAQRTKNDSPSVSKLLASAKEQAVALQSDAADLTAFARGAGNWRGQRVKENAISRDMDKTQEIGRELLEKRQVASPRQDAVIDEILPLVRDLVYNTRAMLDHVKSDPADVHSSSCIEYLTGHQEIAEDLTSQIVNAVDSSAKDNARR